MRTKPSNSLRPKNLAGERDSKIKKKKEWLTHYYPKILQQADESDTAILFMDESTAKSEHHWGRTWGRYGRKVRFQASS